MRYVLALIALALLAWWRPGHADTYSCLRPTGEVIFQKTDPLLAAWPCVAVVESGTWASATVRHVQADGKQSDVKLYSATGAGVWTWVAPTVGLANLDHYTMYRQVTGAAPTLFAQIDGRTQKLLLPMGTAEFGACFWLQSVDKAGVENPQQSNKICLGPTGLPLPVL